MIVFILFCVIVLLSLAIQWLSNNWLVATTVPCFIFVVLIFTGSVFPSSKTIAFFLGIPMIFFAGLLGSYLYETRLNPDRHKDNKEEPSAETD
jgi:hypothetical protein